MLECTHYCLCHCSLYAAPSAPPSSVVAIATDATTVFISWQQPPDETVNGIIKYYRINVDVVNTMESMQFQTSNTNLTLSGLHPHYTYTVLVLAFTVAPGPFSTAVTVQTLQKGKLAVIILKCNTHHAVFHLEHSPDF